MRHLALMYITSFNTENSRINPFVYGECGPHLPTSKSLDLSTASWCSFVHTHVRKRRRLSSSQMCTALAEQVISWKKKKRRTKRQKMLPELLTAVDGEPERETHLLWDYDTISKWLCLLKSAVSGTISVSQFLQSHRVGEPLHCRDLPQRVLLTVMDREAWSAAVRGVTKSQTRLSDWTELNWWRVHTLWE